MKNCLLVSLLFLVAISAVAQTQWTGVIRKKPWAKTIESYCAQGSDYYVLVTSKETYVLAPADDAATQQIARMKDRRVTLIGQLETRTITPDPSSQHPISMEQPVEQRPVKQAPVKQAPAMQVPSTQRPSQMAEEAFTCTVLRVKSVKVSDKK